MRLAITANQRGLSLVELMISMTIGLIITLSIATLFVNTNRSNKENTDITVMQENARFAMETIATDLRHAGFVGNLQNASEVDVNGVTMPTGTDCGSTAVGASFMLDFSANRIVGYANGMTNSAMDALIAPCVTATGMTLPAANNTVLAIKRSISNIMTYSAFHAMTTGKEDGRIFVFTNGSTARLGMGDDEPLTQPETEIFEYRPRYYYITHTALSENGSTVYKHTLYRSTYSDVVPGEWSTEPLAEGIEQFAIEFGIDHNDDGSADGTPNYYSGDSATIEVDKIVSARVHVLARTLKADINYSDGNTYWLGQESYTPSTDTTNPDPNKARYHREVYSTSFNIPNLRVARTLN